MNKINACSFGFYKEHRIQMNRFTPLLFQGTNLSDFSERSMAEHLQPSGTVDLCDVFKTKP